ncbi:ABC transporter ATP-binding protein [Geomonas sp.]|uniref:ABC transporter ATP-binding protein n=1 Tax=Geomonas sp. TaxID=2651584 RepID=UPI002B477440|nr:ABC transporter ATP-binding protein [Geomonas sp.]
MVAVDGLSFEVNQGEIFGLVGPDGAGKTTTLRMLAGVLPPDSGSAKVAGFDIVADPEAAKPLISYMPQRFGLYEELTVNENIRFYAEVFGISKQDRINRAPELLKAAGLGPFGDRRAGQLSGGMKQKLGLVCALIHTPKVILLDEPTNGVDPVSRRDFWRLLYDLVGQGVAILTSTAYLDEAERCHRVALLHEGRLLFCDTPAELKKNLQGAVLAVVSAQPERVQQALAGAEGIKTVVLVGDGLHLVVEDAQRRVEELRKRLTDAAAPFDSIEEVTPTVEDLFVAAVEEEKKKEGR